MTSGHFNTSVNTSHVNPSRHVLIHHILCVNPERRKQRYQCKGGNQDEEDEKIEEKMGGESGKHKTGETKIIVESDLLPLGLLENKEKKQTVCRVKFFIITKNYNIQSQAFFTVLKFCFYKAVGWRANQLIFFILMVISSWQKWPWHFTDIKQCLSAIQWGSL